MLQWLLNEKPPGFPDSALVLWQLLSDWMKLAVPATGLVLHEPSREVLIDLLCGKQALLQRYMLALSGEHVLVVLTAHLSLCQLAAQCMPSRPDLLALMNNSAFSTLLLNQLAGACHFLYGERIVQQAATSSITASCAAASTSTKLAQLQLFPDHMSVPRSTADSKRVGAALLDAYADGMRGLVEAAASDSEAATSSNNGNGHSSSSYCSSRSDLPGAFTTVSLKLLDLQVAPGQGPAHKDYPYKNNPALSAAAMQLLLEAAALQEKEDTRSTALELLKHQAARASREQRSYFISNRGQLLLEVLWLAAVETYTDQQQQVQRQQQGWLGRRLRWGLGRASQQTSWQGFPTHVEVLYQLAHGELTKAGDLTSRGEMCHCLEAE